MSEPPSMEGLSKLVIESLISASKTFAASGFAEYAERFPAYDWLAGKTVVVETPDSFVEGAVAGIADDGALLVDTESGRCEIHAGTIKRVDDAVAAQ
jgi:biotin-(acetyl-CoA carboxylase) ligase